MPDLDILERFKTDARSKRGRLKEVAQATGLTEKQLRNILYGATKEPRYTAVDKLRAFYSDLAA